LVSYFVQSDFKMNAFVRALVVVVVLVQGASAWNLKRFCLKSAALISSVGLAADVARAELAPAPWDSTGNTKRISFIASTIGVVQTNSLYITYFTYS
jgi:hypothetical protein